MAHDISWKSESFFKDVVARDLTLEGCDSFTIARFNIGKANEKTAGYMSFIYRVSIEVQHGNKDQPPAALTYIVKEKTDQAFGGDLCDILAVFPKEIEMYEKILPAFERLFVDGEPVRFGPKMFKSISAPFTVIVMEDLNRSQYRMREKSFGLPMADVKNILRKLAQFHAASVVYRDTNGAYSDLFSEGVISERTVDALGRHYEFLYSAFVQSLQERNLPKKYLEPLIALDKRLLKACCKAQVVDASEFNVLNHGDVWPNNVMFAPDDLLFLDFQTTSYGSFAVDILYFFITSATEVICDSFEELVQFYYQHLASALQQLRYEKPIPLYTELLQQLKRRGVLMLPPLSEAVAITMTGLTEVSQMEMITSDQPEGVELRALVYNNPSYVSLVDRLIPKLFELGFLDGSNM
uniref:CHK kinase-like domain-containing protein n=1 Tax=Anopheles farauti TaxID=69004 RepID=A0A182QGH7_9DIPT